MTKPIIGILILSFSFAAQSAKDCRANHQTSSVSVGQSADREDLSNFVFGFSQDPKALKKIEQLVEKASVRSKVEKIKGFNVRIEEPAKTPEKTVREQTPWTVGAMGDLLVREGAHLGQFDSIGLVAGDPHFGNYNTSPVVFRDSTLDRNLYTLTDLDETTLGYMTLDFTRYWIFLVAKYGNLDAKFGKGFEKELVDAYARGLRQEPPVEMPSFVAEPLKATPEQIRAKIQKYADSRVNKTDGKFLPELFGRELIEFKTKNMKPQFLQEMGFNPRDEKSDKKEFKNQIISTLKKSLKSDFEGEIRILDVAIPNRDSGGSAKMQRFLVSTELEFEGQVYRMIVEFKENEKKAAWEAVIENDFDSAANRYRFGLEATMDDPGPFMKVVEFTKNLSFLMRPKGNIDAISDGSRKQDRQKALFDAHEQGLFHGGQGVVSVEHVNRVSQNPREFQAKVAELGNIVLKKFSKETGLKPPK